MRRALLHFFTNAAAGLFVLCTAVPAFAADETKATISVNAELDRAFITIGDPVVYTVTVKHDPTLQILSTIPPPDADIFKIKKVEDIQEEQGKQKVEGRRFTLTAYKLGEYILEPIQIQYRSGNDPPKTIATDKLFLSVKSVAAGEAKVDIRGAKAVVSLPHTFGGLFILLLALVAAAAGVFLYQRRHKTPEALRPQEPELSPEEEAFLHLNQLFDSDLLRKGKVKEYYLRFSEILKIYFERRFQILAVESTTDEILHLLRQKEIDRNLLQKIAGTLESADLAKFAKWKPLPAEIIQLNQKAKQIVEEAKPREVPSGV